MQEESFSEISGKLSAYVHTYRIRLWTCSLGGIYKPRAIYRTTFTAVPCKCCACPNVLSSECNTKLAWILPSARNEGCKPTLCFHGIKGMFYKLVLYSFKKCSYAWPLFKLSLVSFYPLNTYIARYVRV